MKTRRIPAASTAALLGCAAVAAPAFAAGVDVEYDEDGIDIGGGVLAFINDSDEEKFEDYTLEASTDTLTGKDNDEGVKMVDPENDPVIKDLSKSLKKEFAKIKLADIEVYKIDLAKGIYSEDNSPAAIKITIPSVGFDAKVYHVSDNGSVKALKATTRQLVGGGYEVSFTTRDFSSFILTTAELKNASAANTSSTSSNTSTSSGANAPANANTGIALAIAPVLLAGTAVSVVAMKKKK